MAKLTLHEKWESEKDEEIKVITKDGIQKLVYPPDGREEILDKSHSRYDHWHNK